MMFSPAYERADHRGKHPREREECQRLAKLLARKDISDLGLAHDEKRASAECLEDPRDDEEFDARCQSASSACGEEDDVGRQHGRASTDSVSEWA